ncbi:alpha/beta fold hydrolase [Williamsia sp. 1135]|uniref:thioesterase II family protein n=1 Tax=Williamsia sp. 1135 TaxID=1889262 RepID=UPI000A0F636C|nr:alpha/beta fold hydrolase [Williamsia sp. 1135]ORM26899.1 thioesterase [Williamsia sp. 1135]
MSRDLGWIRQFHKPVSADNPPLLIFPHAGSGASTYRAFSKQLSAIFDVAVIQYPGRQDRVRETPAQTLPELARGAFDEFVSSRWNRQVPITVFGHSMGAIVAFEFVRLAEATGIEVRLLGVSAAVAPSQVENLPPHPREDQELLAHLSALNGTGGDVLASADLMRMALPVMKMDYRAFDAYSCAADVTVAAEIQALGGAEDPFIKPRELYGWSTHTTGESGVSVFDGGHFYLDDNRDPIAELLAPQPSVSQTSMYR